MRLFQSFNFLSELQVNSNQLSIQIIILCSLDNKFLHLSSSLKIEITKNKEDIKDGDIKKDITQKIFDLIQNKNLSVRNLIKLWIIQIKARELYNFFKQKEIFVINENNKNEKIYNFEKLKNISKKWYNTHFMKMCVKVCYFE